MSEGEGPGEAQSVERARGLNQRIMRACSEAWRVEVSVARLCLSETLTLTESVE